MSEKREIQQHSVPESVCPHCGYKPDMATGLTAISPGAFGVCLNCGEINQFDAELRLVKADPMEALRCELDQGEAGKMVRAARLMSLRRKICRGPI